MKVIKSHLKEWHKDHSVDLFGKTEELKKAVNTLEFKGESTSLSDEEIRFKYDWPVSMKMIFISKYATSDNVVDLKGKVACEISSADELILIELMFNGVSRTLRWRRWFLSWFVLSGKKIINNAANAKPREELDLLYT